MNYIVYFLIFFFFKQKTAYEMRISDWSSDVCSSDLIADLVVQPQYWFAINGVQVKHENGRRLGYRADFAYRDIEKGADVVEDVKGGYRDDAWTIRKAVFRALFPNLELRSEEHTSELQSLMRI